MLQLSHNIKVIRKLKGQTQEEFLRNFTGITLSMQKSYETGRAMPGPLYLSELSKMTGAPVDALKKYPVEVEKVQKGVKVARVDSTEIDTDTAKEPQPTTNSTPNDEYLMKYIRLLEKTNQEQSDIIKGILNRIETNLNDAANRQQIFRIMTNAGQQVMLETLAQQQGLNKYELVHKARSIGDAHLHDIEETYNFDSLDSSDK